MAELTVCTDDEMKRHFHMLSHGTRTEMVKHAQLRIVISSVPSKVELEH